MIKSVDPGKTLVHDEEKHEKTKVKKKLGKTHDEQIQVESNISASLPINSTTEENENEKEKEIHKYNTEENPQTKMTDTANTMPNINYNDELKDIIGSLLEEMRSLRNMVHHDITDLQKAISQQNMDISKLEESVVESKNDIRKYLTDKVENNTRRYNRYWRKTRPSKKKMTN